MRIIHILKSISVLFLSVFLSDLPEASVGVRGVGACYRRNAKSLYSAFVNWNWSFETTVLESRIYRQRKGFLRSHRSTELDLEGALAKVGESPEGQGRGPPAAGRPEQRGAGGTDPGGQRVLRPGWERPRRDLDGLKETPEQGRLFPCRRHFELWRGDSLAGWPAALFLTGRSSAGSADPGWAADPRRAPRAVSTLRCGEPCKPRGWTQIRDPWKTPRDCHFTEVWDLFLAIAPHSQQSGGGGDSLGGLEEEYEIKEIYFLSIVLYILLIYKSFIILKALLCVLNFN